MNSAMMRTACDGCVRGEAVANKDGPVPVSWRVPGGRGGGGVGGVRSTRMLPGH